MRKLLSGLCIHCTVLIVTAPCLFYRKLYATVYPATIHYWEFSPRVPDIFLRDLLRLFEAVRKIALAAEPNGICDLRDSHLCIFQKLHALIDPKGIQV